MKRRSSRTAPAASVAVESLEGRLMLSGTEHAVALRDALPHRSVEIAASTVGHEGTKTLLTVSAGTLGQPITFSVTVRAAAAAGSPAGTVELLDHGAVIRTLTLSPEPTTTARYAFSGASYTLTQLPGASAYYFGKHPVSALFIPSGAFSKSTGRATFIVRGPTYTSLAGGVEIATITPGTGPGIQSGQTASVLYTGYLARNGHIFDDSIDHGGTPIRFALGAGLVISGFDEGTVGMQVGETRIIRIPPAEGYGRSASGPIPGNSTLIFVVTLEAIS
jgi:hypothetical protein